MDNQTKQFRLCGNTEKRCKEIERERKTDHDRMDRLIQQQSLRDIVGTEDLSAAIWCVRILDLLFHFNLFVLS